MSEKLRKTRPQHRLPMSSQERGETTPAHQHICTTVPSSTPASTISVLDIPPELLIHILEFLPIRSLLAFSQTSRFAHTISRSGLHTLRLGIHASRVCAIISLLGGTQYPRPTTVESAFMPSSDRETASPQRGWVRAWTKGPTVGGRRDSVFKHLPLMNITPPLDFENNYGINDSADPHRVAVVIPYEAAYHPRESHSSDLLLQFHTALTCSILTRFGAALTTVDLIVWTMTAPVARGVAALTALRTLFLRVEGIPNVRTVPRRREIAQKKEQQDAWMLLAKTARWRGRVRALRIESAAGLEVEHLRELLSGARQCKELWLSKCADLGVEVWRWLGEEWEERKGLEILGVIGESGSGDGLDLNEEALGWIGGLTGLKFLCLMGCFGVERVDIDEMNKKVWGIEEVVLPISFNVVGSTQSTFIEVDPLYMGDDDHDGEGFALPALAR